MADKTIVAGRDNGGISQGHYGEGFAGGAAKEDILGKPSKSYREKMWKIVRETGEIHVDGETHGREVLTWDMWKESDKR